MQDTKYQIRDKNKTNKCWWPIVNCHLSIVKLLQESQSRLVRKVFLLRFGGAGAALGQAVMGGDGSDPAHGHLQLFRHSAQVSVVFEGELPAVVPHRIRNHGFFIVGQGFFGADSLAKCLEGRFHQPVVDETKLKDTQSYLVVARFDSTSLSTVNLGLSVASICLRLGDEILMGMGALR